MVSNLIPTIFTIWLILISSCVQQDQAESVTLQKSKPTAVFLQWADLLKKASKRALRDRIFSIRPRIAATLRQPALVSSTTLPVTQEDIDSETVYSSEAFSINASDTNLEIDGVLITNWTSSLDSSSSADTPNSNSTNPLVTKQYPYDFTYSQFLKPPFVPSQEDLAKPPTQLVEQYLQFARPPFVQPIDVLLEYAKPPTIKPQNVIPSTSTTTSLTTSTSATTPSTTSTSDSPVSALMSSGLSIDPLSSVIFSALLLTTTETPTTAESSSSNDVTSTFEMFESAFAPPSISVSSIDPIAASVDVFSCDSFSEDPSTRNLSAPGKSPCLNLALGPLSQALPSSQVDLPTPSVSIVPSLAQSILPQVIQPSNLGLSVGSTAGASSDSSSSSSAVSAPIQSNLVERTRLIIAGVVTAIVAGIAALIAVFFAAPAGLLAGRKGSAFTVFQDKIPIRPNDVEFSNYGCDDSHVQFHDDGRCYPLLRRGFCTSSLQWITLDPVTGKGRCTPRPSGKAGMSIRHSSFNIHSQCSNGRRLYYSAYGNPICSCPIGQYPFPNAHDECVPLFTRGPCPDKQIVAVTHSGKLACQPAACRPVNGRSFPSQLVPWNDGRCYALGSRGPCISDSYALGYDVFGRQPVCVNIPQRSPSVHVTRPQERAFYGRSKSNGASNDTRQTERYGDHPLLLPCRIGTRRRANWKCNNMLIPSRDFRKEFA